MRILLLLLASSVLVRSAEVFAWKVPVSNFSWEGLEARGVVVLKNPPEKSPFFNKDDALWDVAEAVTDRFGMAEDSFDWAIWNATTGRLVAKGPAIAIHTLHYYMEVQGLFVQCRHMIDVYRVADDGTPADFSRKPDASLSVISRSGQRSNASFSKDGTSILFEGTGHFSEDKSFIDLTILVSASLPDTPKIEINTAAVIPNESGVWIAREFDGSSGLDLRISSEITLFDGTPFSQVTLRQEGEITKPFSVERSHRKPVAMGDGAWLVFAWLDYGSVLQMFGEPEKDRDIDPFGEESQQKAKVALENLLRTETPEVLAPYFAGPVFDLTEKLQGMGLLLGEKDFAGYDPRIGHVFLYSSEKAELEKFEQLFATYCGGRVSHVAITSRGNGQMRLVARSGQKAQLKSTGPTSKHTRTLEIEPTIGENDDLIDLRLFFEEKSDEEFIRSLNTSTTLLTGKFVELLKETLPDGSEMAMDFKAEVTKSN